MAWRPPSRPWFSALWRVRSHWLIKFAQMRAHPSDLIRSCTAEVAFELTTELRGADVTDRRNLVRVSAGVFAHAESFPSTHEMCSTSRQVARLLEDASEPKYKAALSLVYGAGLRAVTSSGNRKALSPS